ncbi:MAG: hypothetical protein EOM51_07940 [Clostridia bacterium]|nr:hypothetical protein [Clostridia bacterium]
MIEFRSTIKNRLILLTICTVLSVALVYIGALLTQQAETASSTFADGFVKGFPLGLFSGFVAVMVFLIVRCIRALGSDEYLKKLYITENDERKTMIRQSAMGKSFFFTAGSLVVGITVASFFDNTITLTLAAVLTVHVLTGAILKLYYFLKY